NQLKADTINILLKNKVVDQIKMLKAGFVSSKADSSLFNQMKGKNMYGYFETGEMKRLLVDGNGESVYYAKDDSGAYIGVNKIARWAALSQNGGYKGYVLSSNDDHLRYYSFGSWENIEAMNLSRKTEEFKSILASLGELCDDFVSESLTLTASI